MTDGTFKGHYEAGSKNPPGESFEFRGGCTLIFDLNTLQLRYAISKPLLNTSKLTQFSQIREIDVQRIEQQYRYLHDDEMMCMTDYAHYFGNGLTKGLNEPFAFLHNH
jgi:hypothetical protein